MYQSPVWMPSSPTSKVPEADELPRPVIIFLAGWRGDLRDWDHLPWKYCSLRPMDPVLDLACFYAFPVLLGGRSIAIFFFVRLLADFHVLNAPLRRPLLLQDWCFLHFWDNRSFIIQLEPLEVSGVGILEAAFPLAFLCSPFVQGAQGPCQRPCVEMNPSAPPRGRRHLVRLKKCRCKVQLARVAAHDEFPGNLWQMRGPAVTVMDRG